jgi:exodeoxyribonuclease VII small subunit
MNKKITYAQAMERLQTIVEGLENNTLGVDELTTQIKEANELVGFCKQRLSQTTTDIDNLLQQ